MSKKLDYTVTLLETLKHQSIELLRETSRAVFRIPHAKNMARDELAEKICAMLLANPMGYLYGDIGLLPNFMMDVIFDMIDKGPQRLQTTGADGVVARALSHLYFVDKRDWNDGKNTGTQTFALPKELIETFSDNMDAIEALRNFGDDLELYANAAAILYGVVSLTELIEIVMRYRPNIEPAIDEQTLRLFILGRKDEASYWFLHGDLVCHNEFKAGSDAEMDEVIEDFLADRKDKPRWFPENEEAFLRYDDENENLDTPEAKALAKWLADHGTKDDDKLYNALYDTLYGIQHGNRSGKVIEKLLVTVTGKGVDGATQEFLDLYMNFANRMRLRVNNGHTAEEMLALAKPVRLSPIIKVNSHAAVGRNDPCPCGSGKKFKKCCGKKGNE